jgi:predicted esterase
MYAGFSQGATLSRGALVEAGRKYGIVALAEGGYDLMVDPKFARALKDTSAPRVLLVCGNPGCFAHANRAQRTLEAAGLSVFVSGDPQSGHNLNERMQVALRKTWPDLVRGIAGWESFRPPRN